MWTIKKNDSCDGYEIGTLGINGEFDPVFERTMIEEAIRLVCTLNGGFHNQEAIIEILEDICAATERIANRVEQMND